MGDTIKVILIGARRYEFEDKNGKTVRGCTAHFHAVNPANVDASDEKGFIPSKVNLPYEFYEKLPKTFPVPAEAILEQSLGSKGVVSKVVDFRVSQQAPKL